MSDVVATIADFVDAVNRGHQEDALSRLTDDVTIIEDLAPYRWHGPTAGAEWLRAMFENAQRNGIASISMQLAEARRVELEGQHAYAIVEGLLTYGGTVERRSDGLLTFALVMHGERWMIRAFSWTGPKAT
jgi:ketosteroid isomerase-like protein